MISKSEASAAMDDNNLFQKEMDELFNKRSLLVLWLAVPCFLFFSILDFIVHTDFFYLFLTYRIGFICFVFLCITIVQLQLVEEYRRIVMGAALIVSSLTISLMVIELGGFYSTYYVGIVLVVAFSFFILPMSVLETVIIGIAMFLVYMILVLVTHPFSEQMVPSALNNTFFYLSMLTATVVKSHYDIKSRRAIWEQQAAVSSLHDELNIYNRGLEEIISTRLKQIKELEYNHRELYENIQDMAVVIDDLGDIILCNHRFSAVFGKGGNEDGDKSFFNLVEPEQQRYITDHFCKQLSHRHPFMGQEVRMVTVDSHVWVVEMSGNWVDLDDSVSGCQLVLRNVTHRKEMERQMQESSRLVDKSRRAAIIGIAKLAERRDDDTGAHLDRIRQYTRVLTLALSENPGMQHLVTPSFLENITLSSVLHDIGKVGIPDSILLKPGKLTREEYTEMKKHAAYGCDVLAVAEHDAGDVSFLTMGQEIALSHHEKWDGSGYPHGLAKAEIPLSARIVALADVYDALTSMRCYKQPISHRQSRDIIVKERGHHFDPEVVDAFLEQEDQFKAIRMEMIIT